MLNALLTRCGRVQAQLCASTNCSLCERGGPRAKARSRPSEELGEGVVKASAALVHDGSAATPAEAIRRHGGEASGVIERYNRATEPMRRALLAFLDSL